MSRRLRQLDELRCLCGAGAVGRAIDLAFAHFADFGRDDAVLRLLDEAIHRVGAAADVHRRLSELTAGW